MIRFIYGSPELYSPKTNGFYFPLEPAHIWTTVGHLGIIKTDCWASQWTILPSLLGTKNTKETNTQAEERNSGRKFEFYWESLNVAELGTNVANIERDQLSLL